MAESNGNNPAAADDTVEKYTPAEVTAPIIVSLGKKKRKVVKQLKRGKGKAMDEVMEVLDQVQERLGDQAEDKILVPVVVIYKEKPRRIRSFFR